MATSYNARAVDYPDSFKSPLLQRFEPFPVLTGTAFSSHAPASIFFHPLNIPTPVGLTNIYCFKSFADAVPTATGQASTGSQGYSYGHSVSLFQRQDYGANSTNLTFVGSASGGLTATLGYSSTSQVFGFSWATDTAGGTSGVSTTSNAAAWSNSLSGQFMFPIPMVTILTAGEYWIAHRHSSTTGTSNSNITLLSVSNLHITQLTMGFINLGQSTTNPSSVLQGIGMGVASAVTTNNSMAASVVSNSVVNLWVQELSGA